jgi:hypothetical protein
MLSEGDLYSLFREWHIETGETLIMSDVFKVVMGPISEPEGAERGREMV